MNAPSLLDRTAVGLGPIPARCDCGAPVVSAVLVPSAAEAFRCQLACPDHEPNGDRIRLDEDGRVNANAWADLAERRQYRAIIVLAERLSREEDARQREAERLEEIQREADLQAQVLSLVAELGPISRNALQEERRRRRSSISEALRGLAAGGAVLKTPTGWVPGPRARDPLLSTDLWRGRPAEEEVSP
jgi:hypothetical protein